MTGVNAEPGRGRESVRRENLATVLRLVHRSGTAGRSRSDLTAATGLNRSTIAALVAELSAVDLVAESEPATRTGVGRPSPIVTASVRTLALAVNPELDAITLAVVALGGRVVHRIRHEVDHIVSPAEAVSVITAELAGLRGSVLAGARLAGIGIAVPGLVRWAPHLGWDDAPLTDLVERATGVPTRAANDASLGALAEHVFGVGRGIDDLVYLNGGASGIGGGVIAGGRPLAGAVGYAGEFGHNRPGVADPADRVTRDGALEDEVSRARLLTVAGLTAADEATLAAALLDSGDPAVRTELARQRRILATAISNAVNVLDPTLVVLGGFLATILASDPDQLRRLVAAQAIPAVFAGTRLEAAALGPDILMVGAGELAFAGVLADPAGYERGAAAAG